MAVTEPKTVRWSLEDYYRIADAGVFRDRRVELIEGEVVEMPPQKSAHCTAILLVRRALEEGFGQGYVVRDQGPLHLTPDSAPEPDLAVVAGDPRDYKDHPDSALLIVEVSDTTLSFDQRRKAALYAAADIRDYWIVNLPGRKLEVRREPKLQGGEWDYASVESLDQTRTVVPLAAPKAQIKVADLLP